MALGEEFTTRTFPFRRELLAHCYRMLGSIHDAEDLVQETFLRAWGAYDRFDEHLASMRTWLYKIATNACLTALESRARRPVPQPIPGTRAEGDSIDPAAMIAARRGLRLALVAAIRLLSPRQRAVLILHDVLDWPAADVADMLDSTPSAVYSALQRARSRLAKVSPGEDEIPDPADPVLRAVVERYVMAFENGDVAALKQLLTEDTVVRMPVRGRETRPRIEVPIRPSA